MYLLLPSIFHFLHSIFSSALGRLVSPLFSSSCLAVQGTLSHRTFCQLEGKKSFGINQVFIYHAIFGYFIFHFFLFTHFVYSDCRLFRTVFPYVLNKSLVSKLYNSVLCKYLVQFKL